MAAQEANNSGGEKRSGSGQKADDVGSTKARVGGSNSGADLREVEKEVKKNDEGVSIWLESVKKGNSSLLEMIKRYDVNDAKTERLVVEKLREQVDGLQQVAANISRRGPGFKKDLELYETALGRAAKSYGELSQIYQRKAIDATNERYQKLYRQMSEGASAKAAMMEESRKGIEPTKNSVDKLLKDVEKSREILRDISGFLDVSKESDKLSKNIEEFMHDIDTYNKELMKTVENIEAWVDKQGSGSSEPPAPKRQNDGA